LGWHVGLSPVEVARAVGTGGHAAAAAHAAVVVDDHDAVGLLPGGLHRAHLGARRVATVVALHGHVEVALARHRLGAVIEVGVVGVAAVLLVHRHHAAPLDLGSARLVVLLHARIHAATAADAAREVEAVAERHALLRRLAAHGDLALELRAVFALEPL